MRKNQGLLLGWPYKSCGGKELVDYDNPIIDTSNGHIFTSAPTGSGKGVSYSVPALLSWPGSMVALDIKGELAHITARHREEMGQDVYILDPFNITPFESTKLNPLDALNDEDPDIVSTTSHLYEMMMSDITNSHQAFWYKAAKSMLTGITLGLYKEHGAGNLNFEQIGDKVDDPHEAIPFLLPFGIFKRDYDDPLEAKIAYLKEKEEIENLPTLLNDMKKSDIRIVRKTGQLFNNHSKTTIQSIQAVASEALAIAEGGMASKALNNTTIPLQDLVNGKPMTIYIVIPPEKLFSHRKILTMWFGLIFSQFFKRRNWSGPETLLLIDEIAQLGYMPEFLTSITLLRNYGVKVWSIWQDIDQLKSTYPNDWQIILNGCRTQLWFGINNGIAASRATEAIDGFTKKDLLKMSPLDAVIVRDRHDPEIIRRPNYLRHDIWKDCYDSNPYYANKPIEPKDNITEINFDI